MKLFHKVAIVGTGLIGGSLALAIKERHLADFVVGVSRHKETLGKAKARGAIDQGSLSLGIIKGADLVVLAVPVKKILGLAPAIAKIIAKDCVVTDTGSTKEEICCRLSKIFPHFIGSHPLAGSEKRGIVNADERVFQGTLCILTPIPKPSRRALGKLKLLWSGLGAKTVLLSPAEHDRILSFTSHLPHALAFSLISSVPGEFFKFSSGGLRDTTRIASSDAELWADIFLSNRKKLLKAISLFQGKLSFLKSAVSSRDSAALVKFLKSAKEKRDGLI
ncbi:MAG: prephenate dehydrogenase [Candidatus Omnitrophota bacterium]|nr:prephenate dehydrogenase [Candidatus Omnitrophota bacterium]